MKKLSLLLVSVALFSFVSLNSCKQASKPAAESEEVMEEAPATEDTTMAADTSAMEEAAPAEEPAAE